MPFVFVSQQGAVLSVFPDVVGEPQRRRMQELRGDKLAVVAGDWIGQCSEHEVRGDVRMGRQFDMYSVTGYYSMMVSWPEGDKVSEGEAEELERDVIWSYKGEGK